MADRGPTLALVTGAAHRLGRTLALTLAHQGCAICLHYNKSLSKANKTAAELKDIGVPVILAQADLKEPDQVRSLFLKIDASSYKLGVVVNSAAIMSRGDFRTLSVDEWDTTFNLNLRAPFLCAQEAARRMESGLIVNITDIGAHKVWSAFPAYTVSKAALEVMTRVLARTLSPAVRVNAIAPGLVFPSQNIGTAAWEKLVRRIPLKRIADEEEIASALVFLLKNSYITGQTIVVDGGYSLV